MPQHRSPGQLSPAVENVYGVEDLSQNACFSGGFINFGYWESIDLDAPLTESDRVYSQKALYRLVLTAADIDESSRLLEVGCGRGLGCTLALNEFGPRTVDGVDAHPDQVRRAKAGNTEDPARLRFQRGFASALPFPDNSFDRLCSVEAAQHFPSLQDFVAESARVLAPGGRFAVTTFFPVRAGLEDRIKNLLNSFAEGLDVAHPLPLLVSALADSGFSDVSATSIGEHVWPGYDRWVARTRYADSWPRNFKRAHTEGLIDYYLVTANLPRTPVP
jgi:cyclopropane fatty-acyl-phospholipid synthase-like methyltransferase